MAVTIQNKDQEEENQAQKEVREKHDDAIDKVVDSLDLPEIDEQGGEVETKLKMKDLNDLENEDPKEDPDEDPKEDPDEDPKEDPEEDPEEEKEEDSEVVSKSKFDKRISSLTAEKKILEAKLAEKDTSAPVDSRKAKLEAMSETELKSMKSDARGKARIATREEKDDLADQYEDLQDEIDEILREAPVRFQKAQAKSYDEAITEVIGDSVNENIDFEKSGAEIKKIATGIYNSHKDLHTLKSGQAVALKLAVDHFRISIKFKKGKSRTKELKQSNLKLKRKTNLDSSALKGNTKKASTRAKYDKAKSSNSIYDKLDYVSDILNVDQYLPPENK